jgi:putative heme-binding domain-containing protein
MSRLTLLPLLALLAWLPPCATDAQDHTYSSSDIEAGVRLYGSQCALCHGPNGDMINGIDLRRGRFRRAVTDEDLARVITTGAGGGAMPAFSFTPAETTAVIALIRAGFDPSGTAVKVGNIERGRAVYTGKGGCATCHRVQGVGPLAAPDLSDIGNVRTASSLQRTLLDPNRGMLPINRPVRIDTIDGRTIRGRRLNEDTYSVQVIDDKERLVSLLKKDIKTMNLGKTSPMPSFEKTLSADDVADLVAYLLSLRGAQ